LRIPKPSGALWSHVDFLFLWSAQSVSAFGARITRTCVPLAAVLTIHASPASLGILAALSQGPGLVVGLFAGGFVDRSRRRHILIASDLLRAAIVLTVPAAAWLHVLAMPQLYLVAAIAGGLSVLFDIADHAYLPSLIGTAQLVEGNTKLNLTDSVAEIGGPALAGVLVQLLTAPIAIAANAVTYVISALFLSRIRAQETPAEHEAGGTSWRRDLSTGAAAIFRNRFVLPLFLMDATAPLFGSFFATLYVPFAIRNLGLSPTMLGITIGVGGIGAMAGAALASPVSRWLGLGPAIVALSFGGALFTMLVPLAPGSPNIATAMLMAAQFGGDALMVVVIILAASLRQTVLPNEILGRVAAVFKAAGGLCGVVGALAAGLIASEIGVRETVLIAAIGYFLAPLIAVLSPLRCLKSLTDPGVTRAD
jgi:predicted MFS family arabinose efflux permease